MLRLRAIGMYGTAEVWHALPKREKTFLPAEKRWTTLEMMQSWRHTNAKIRLPLGLWSWARLPKKAELDCYSYAYKHIHRAIKALQGSIKTSMRMDDEGLMSLQMAMPISRTKQGERQSFIEFRVSLTPSSLLSTLPHERHFTVSRS